MPRARTYPEHPQAQPRKTLAPPVHGRTLLRPDLPLVLEALRSPEPGVAREVLLRTDSLGVSKDRTRVEHMADIMETAARKVFERYDIDGDGLVTADEYRKVVAELEGTEITASQAQELIDSLDTNGDRQMSFEEFWAGMKG